MIEHIRESYYGMKETSQNTFKSLMLYIAIVEVIAPILGNVIVGKPIPFLYKLLYKRVADGYYLVLLSPIVLLSWILVSPLAVALVAILFTLIIILISPILIAICLIPFELMSDFINKNPTIKYSDYTDVKAIEHLKSFKDSTKFEVFIKYNIRWFNIGNTLQKCSVHKTSVFGRDKVCPECEYEFKTNKESSVVDVKMKEICPN